MDLWRSILVDLEAASAAQWPDTPTGPPLLATPARARPAWQRDALCLEHADVSWFPGPGQSAAAAKALCSRCLVREECLEYAIAGSEDGIWGGTSPQERRAMRRDEAA